MSRRLVLLAYAGLVISLPFLVYELPGVKTVFGLWLGGSFLAGFLYQDDTLLRVPCAAFVALMAGYVTGVLDEGLFADSLSAVAIVTMLLGELAGVFVGASVAYSLPRGRSDSYLTPSSP